LPATFRHVALPPFRRAACRLSPLQIFAWSLLFQFSPPFAAARFFLVRPFIFRLDCRVRFHLAAFEAAAIPILPIRSRYSRLILSFHYAVRADLPDACPPARVFALRGTRRNSAARFGSAPAGTRTLAAAPDDATSDGGFDTFHRAASAWQL